MILNVIRVLESRLSVETWVNCSIKPTAMLKSDERESTYLIAAQRIDLILGQIKHLRKH